MSSLFVVGSVERAQSLQESLFSGAGKDAAGNWSTALVEIAVDSAGGSHAAFGCRPEPAAHLLDFLFSHVTSASAYQYSVLIIHVFSPFIIWSPLHGLERLYIGAALAVEGVSVQRACCSQGACGQCP
jgi:hypothetical protein